jgi:hypothetical protein
MSRKPSTAALDSFRHSSFPIRRRAPRHPAGEAVNTITAIQEETMNLTITSHPYRKTRINSTVVLHISLALLLAFLAIFTTSSASAQTKPHPLVKTYPLNRANAENLQRWVNAGHDTWCRDPKLVAAHTLEQFAPGIADSTYELASQPVVRKLSGGRTVTYTYHSLDGQTTYGVTLRRPPWLRPTAGSTNKTVWLPTRLEIALNATT